jgi:predicted DNA-binding transcriptional regulator AlpA
MKRTKGVRMAQKKKGKKLMKILNEITQQKVGPVMTPAQLAKRWDFHVMSLANMRTQGRGPKFIKLGNKVRYPLSEIEAYERSQLRQNSCA